MSLKLKRKHVPVHPEEDIICPFEDIAVSLSGGGFRASAYALGCLAYLQRRKYDGVSLLERVKFLTSASGGTLTGLLFSAYNYRGDSFAEVYNRMRTDILVEDKLLKEAVKVFADDKQWKGSSTKTRNTINAFAKVFQKDVFDDMDFGIYWSKKGTLEAVCFNTSELENGRSFHFQTDGNDTEEIIGNPYLCIRNKNTRAVKKIALGDIMAASACYPAGFEPMVFPDDFVRYPQHFEELSESLVKAVNHNWEEYEPFRKSFVLMDGGITDNQGIESLRFANKRRKQKNQRGFDLILICDVANFFLNPFEPLKEKQEWWNRISVHNIILLHKYAPLTIILSAVLILTNTIPGIAWVMGTVATIMWSLFLLGSYMLAKTPEPIPNDTASIFNVPLGAFMKYILQSPISRSGLMLKSRWLSTVRVAMDVYDLHLRKVNYQTLYHDPTWTYKVKSVSIYELSKSNENVFQRQFIRKRFDEEIIQLLTPSAEMQQIAEYARRMGTTLWFSKEDMTTEKNILDALISCGQFTMCYNLLEYIIELEKEYEDVKKDSQIQQLKSELLYDWRLFQSQPKFMLLDIQAQTD
jgi:hypothetical protein